MPVIVIRIEDSIWESKIGQYIVSFDPYHNENGLGLGLLKTTNRKEAARRFSSGVEAGEFWRQISPTVPTRPDGKPNRPLTAFSVTFENCEENQ